VVIRTVFSLQWLMW